MRLAIHQIIKVPSTSCTLLISIFLVAKWLETSPPLFPQRYSLNTTGLGLDVTGHIVTSTGLGLNSLDLVDLVNSSSESVYLAGSKLAIFEISRH